MVEAVLLTSALLLGGLGDDDSHGSTGTYLFAQTQRVDIGGGLTRVSAENNVPTPRHGYFPLRLFVDNTSGPRQTLKLGFYPSAAGGRSITKSVEVLAGERRTVVLPVPYLFRYGMVRVRGPGITERGDQNVYFNTTYAPQRPVLSLGTPDEFEHWIGHPQGHTTGDLNILSFPPEDAPTELAAYSGYDAVVIPAAELERFSEGQRRALESYAATGGTLVLGKNGRGLAAALPLLKGDARRSQGYGLGSLAVCDGCKVDFGLFAPREPIVSPRITPQINAQRSVRYEKQVASTFGALLPQATAPIGRFLLIIGLFTLAIGPGSIFVARRRGPAALLLTIPATAFLTCSAIIGYSAVQDGFTVHASTRGLTLLDSRQHRAINVGLTAYYANLAPGNAHFSQWVTVLSPSEGCGDSYGPSIDWGENATVGGDFVPSRTYREWGFVSAESTRARVVIKRQDEGWSVQNALGAPISVMVFMADDAEWRVEDVRDGAERAARRGKGVVPALDPSSSDRFSALAHAVVERQLKEGEFLALINGQAFTPSGGLKLNHHDSEQLVRGEFER